MRRQGQPFFLAPIRQNEPDARKEVEVALPLGQLCLANEHCIGMGDGPKDAPPFELRRPNSQRTEEQS